MPSHVKGIHCAVPLAGLLAFAACHQPVCASKRAAREAERERRAAEHPTDENKSSPSALRDPGLMIWDRPAKVGGLDARPALNGPTILPAAIQRPQPGPARVDGCIAALEPAPVLSPEQRRGTLHRPHGPPRAA